MNGIRCIMSLTQDQLPKILHIWHTDLVLVPQGTLIILSEMRSLDLLEQLTDIPAASHLLSDAAGSLPLEWALP